MNNISHANFCNSSIMTKKRGFAVLFMRLQPLHYGHLNFIKTICELYLGNVRVIIGRKSGDYLNPFSFETREKWLLKAKSDYNLLLEILENVPYNIMGDDVKSINSRKRYYFQGLESAQVDIVSGNRELLKFFSAEINLQGIGPFTLRTVNVNSLSIIDFFNLKLYRDKISGTLIRNMIYASKIGSIKPFIPGFVYTDICNKLTNKY